MSSFSCHFQLLLSFSIYIIFVGPPVSPKQQRLRYLWCWVRVNDLATPRCPPWPSSVCPQQESVLFIFYKTRRSRLTAFTYHCSSLRLRRKTAYRDHKRPYSGPSEPEEFQMSTGFANIGKLFQYHIAQVSIKLWCLYTESLWWNFELYPKRNFAQFLIGL